MKYFAYGSNMSEKDLHRWCAKKRYDWRLNFETCVVGLLEDYELNFNYFSPSRNSRAANVMVSNGKRVYGLVFDMKPGDREKLREKEGYCKYYYEIFVPIQINGTIVRDVLTYKAKPEREEKNLEAPTKEYMALIIDAGEKYGFPPDYLEFLKSISTRTHAV
jgi:cation transport regulator ChaC